MPDADNILSDSPTCERCGHYVMLTEYDADCVPDATSVHENRPAVVRSCACTATWSYDERPDHWPEYEEYD